MWWFYRKVVMRHSHSTKYHRGKFRGRRPRKPKIIKSFDPSLLVKQASRQAPLEVVAIKNSFRDFAINDTLKVNIMKKGYKIPTPIQDQIIPYILGGKDVVGLANTGTGKTAAFLIPLTQKIIKDRSQRILIITPTRELAIQIDRELTAFSKELNIDSVLCIGGVSIVGQITKLLKDPHFIIGTPGRITDLVHRRQIKLETFGTIVLDEVDQMLDMGFIGDIKQIIKFLSKPRQSLFFSATIPKNVKPIMDSFLSDPITVSVKTRDTVDNIDQNVIKVGDRSKVQVLEEMLASKEFSKVLIFGRTKHKLNRLERNLRNKGYKVSAIHGNKSQQQRQRVLRQFKKNGLQALLATDIVSRGIDIDNVTHVINFDMPQTYEEYIHRIGRTGRADKTGKAITLID